MGKTSPFGEKYLTGSLIYSSPVKRRRSRLVYAQFQNKFLSNCIITVFRCWSLFVVGSSLATKMFVFGGKFAPSVHKNLVKIAEEKNSFSILCSDPINFMKIA